MLNIELRITNFEIRKHKDHKLRNYDFRNESAFTRRVD